MTTVQFLKLHPKIKNKMDRLKNKKEQGKEKTKVKW